MRGGKGSRRPVGAGPSVGEFSVRGGGLEPPCLAALAPQASASTSFAILAGTTEPIAALPAKSSASPTAAGELRLAKPLLLRRRERRGVGGAEVVLGAHAGAR